MSIIIGSRGGDAWLTQTEWHVLWRRRSWSRHHQWCTQLRCCPAERGPLDLSSAVRTTFLHTAMKRKKFRSYPAPCLQHTSLIVCLSSLTLLGSKSSLTVKLSTTQEADRLRSTQDSRTRRTSSGASLEDPILYETEASDTGCDHCIWLLHTI